MKKYKNTGGKTGIRAYQTGPDFIQIQFYGSSRIYTYSYRKAGKVHVENMKNLAESGSGLNRYLNLNAKNLFDSYL